jgi:hypothetical protein
MKTGRQAVKNERERAQAAKSSNYAGEGRFRAEFKRLYASYYFFLSPKI